MNEFKFMAELGLQVLAEGDASALRRYHVRQRRTWDCGLACTAAALIRLGLKRGPETDEERDALLSTLEEAVGTYRVWTIDLVKILLDQGVNVHFTTTSFGVQDAYEDLAFYGKLDEDKDRVPRVFEEVRSRGPFLEERSVPTDEICDRLATGKEWFLCLIDNAVLEPSRFQSMVDITGEVSYAGHFVLLTEYSFRDNRIIAIDPARDVDKCVLSVHPSRLEAARRAFGTDEDLIAITLPT